MIIEDRQLESIIWLSPAKHGQFWKVFVGDLLVLTTPELAKAEHTITQLRTSVVNALKKQIAELTGNLCRRCQKEWPKKRKTKQGLRVYHFDKDVGWQPCEADFIWLAIIRDTIEREHRPERLCDGMDQSL